MVSIKNFRFFQKVPGLPFRVLFVFFLFLGGSLNAQATLRGSVRDADSIAACNALGLAMVVTGQRHFLH